MLRELEKILSEEDKNILFVGIGNLLKSDDGVGVYISRNIKNDVNVRSLSVEMSIENYIGKINSLNPDILVMIDCVEMKSPAGTIRMLSPEMIKDVTFNTHNISLSRISDFFVMPVYILGIQPEKLDFGEKISYIVMDVANKIIQIINKQEVHHGY
jgi:hydrogenase 3 maturation protease